MNVEVRNVPFNPNGLIYLRQKNGWSIHQGQMPCTALLVGCLVHQEQLRKIGFQRVLELQIARILDHAVSQRHQHSVLALNSFLHNNPIDYQLDHQRKVELSRRQVEIRHNREILSRILNIIKFLAKQNIPFQGHDKCSSSSNRGNSLS